MKFLYVDESGNSGTDPYLVFFAVQIDAYKLKKAMREARPLLKKVEEAYPESLRELKSSKLVNGRAGWRRVDPALRKSLYLELCGALNLVGGTGLCFALDRRRYKAFQESGKNPGWAATPWLTGATVIAMLAQKLNQGLRRNKGLSVLIFDDNKIELPKLSDFLLSSAKEVDEYYARTASSEPFDHIVNTAFAIKSEHSRLVQFSDACAYALRRRAELDFGEKQEEWDGERKFIKKAVRAFATKLKFPTRTWVSSPSCEAADWIKKVGIQDLNTWVVS